MSGAKNKDWAYLLLMVSAFCMGFSLPLGRLFLLAAAVGLAIDAARGRRRLRMPLTGWLWLALLALAVVVTAHGLNPDKGMGKLDKLIWFMGIPVAASVIDSRERFWQVLRALIYGLSFLALRVCIRNPMYAQAISARFAHTRMAAHFPYAQELIHQGSLVDGQRLMVGLVGAVALVMGSCALARMGSRRLELAVQREPAEGDAPVRPWRLRIRLWPLLIILLAAAEILVMKRGSWFSAILVLVALMSRRLRWRRMLLGAVVLTGLAVGVPPIRQRLLSLETEFNADSGGRLAMWTEVAPRLLRERPWGIGFRAMTPELMRKIAPQIERNRDHLHSNFVEMTVSLGWAGLALYLVWVAFLLRDALVSDATPRPIFWMILALFLNGFVEYNFADAEIVILLGLLGGLASAGRRLHNGELDAAARSYPEARSSKSP
jgi:hypothetical protein